MAFLLLILNRFHLVVNGVWCLWTDFCIHKGKSKESGNKLKKEYKFKIQKMMHSRYKYKGDNRYFSFYQRLCRFNQNKINRIIESVFWQADNWMFIWNLEPNMNTWLTLLKNVEWASLRVKCDKHLFSLLLKKPLNHLDNWYKYFYKQNCCL